MSSTSKQSWEQDMLDKLMSRKTGQTVGIVDNDENTQLVALTALQNGTVREVDKRTWPTLRKFLKFWQDEINSEFIKQKKDLGRTVTVKFVGEKDKDILNKDNARDGERIKIEVRTLTAGEVGKLIIEKWLNK